MYSLTKPLPQFMVPNPTQLSEQIEKKVTSQLLPSLVSLCEFLNLNKIRFLGEGNSISSGWIAHDGLKGENVQPLLDRLGKEYIKEQCQSLGIDFSISNFCYCGDNANQTVLEKYQSNPSLQEIREDFLQTMLLWKKQFKNTPFENQIDPDIALRPYPDSKVRLNDLCPNDAFVVHHFHGCTWELLSHAQEIFFQKEARLAIMEESLASLEKLLAFFTSTNPHSYVMVGNVPWMYAQAWGLGNWLNKEMILPFNQQIVKVTSKQEKAIFLDTTTFSGVQKGKWLPQIDNHPSLTEQYASLILYLDQMPDYLSVIAILDRFHAQIPAKDTYTILEQNYLTELFSVYFACYPISYEKQDKIKKLTLLQLDSEKRYQKQLKSLRF